MIPSRLDKALLGIAFAAALVAAAPSAEAGAVRVKFTPPFGSPFADLSWGGEAVMDDGNCNTTGSPVWNIGSGSPNCNGEFTFLSAQLHLYQTSNPSNDRTITLTAPQFGTVVAVDRNNTTTANAIYSSPFDPVQAPSGFLPSLYGGSEAWFSLIFVGEYAQLYWFQSDPGEPLFDPLQFPYVQWPNAYYYLPGVSNSYFTAGGCYQPGDHVVGSPLLHVPYMHCGISDADNARGARLQITEYAIEVPEPQSIALALAALGAAAWVTRRRRT